MNVESKLSGHWTDDQLIAHLYGVGPEDGHGGACRECQDRLAGLRSSREAREHSIAETMNPDFLARQRRQIYAKIGEQPRLSWLLPQWRRWASAVAAVCVLSGGALYYEGYQHRQALEDQVSDVQLAQDVSHMSVDSEAQPTAPLQALFE